MLPEPRGPGNTCGNATPLPKPGKLRSSASIKRASRHSHSRAVSAADARSLRELDSAVDKTPTGALRALMGIREQDGRPTPAEIVASFESPHKEARMERSASYQSIREPKEVKELAALVAAVKALPESLAAQIECVLSLDEGAAEARREEQRKAILDVLDAAESRAEAREIRLQGLLAEVSLWRTELTSGQGLQWTNGVVGSRVVYDTRVAYYDSCYANARAVTMSRRGLGATIFASPSDEQPSPSRPVPWPPPRVRCHE